MKKYTVTSLVIQNLVNEVDDSSTIYVYIYIYLNNEITMTPYSYYLLTIL